MTAEMTPLSAVNALDRDAFVAVFGGVAEHAPWVAAAAAADRPFATREAMIAAFQRAIRSAIRDRQRELLLAHPDLAGKAAIAGELTAESTNEQKGAGLDRLTAAEFARFTELNDAYRRRHGIPFIFAVRGATKDQILAGFEARLGNPEAAEFAAALEQVCQIVRFRLEDRVGT